MISKEAIDAALTAHAQWKSRLLEAISKGKSEFNVETVKKDDACQFGKWLYGLVGKDKDSVDFQKVKTLHAEFHKTAGEILELALKGKKLEAQRKLEPGGGYGSISGKLVFALTDWKGKL